MTTEQEARHMTRCAEESAALSAAIDAVEALSKLLHENGETMRRIQSDKANYALRQILATPRVSI